MTEEDLYWNSPRAYYLSAACLFLFMAFIILWMFLWPAFWNSIDPLYSFFGYVCIFAPAGLGVFMVFLGRSLAGKRAEDVRK